MRSTRAFWAPFCSRTVLAMAALLAALHGDASARALSVDELLTAMGFSVADQQRIKDGKIVTTDLASSTNRELAVGLAFTMALAPQNAVVTLREAIYRRDPKVLVWGKINGDGTAEDLRTLTLGPAGLSAAQAFLDAAPGESLNLSSQEIAAFAALKAQQPQPGQVQPAVEQQIRTLLLARHRAYRAGGLSAIAPYDRGSGRILLPGEQLKDATNASHLAAQLSAAVRQCLLNYPHDKPPELDEGFYWVVYNIDGRPTVALSHRMWADRASDDVVIDRLYYVSNGFNTEQAVGGFLPAENGTMVLYSNRVSTDQVDGFGSSMKRAIGDHMMADELGASFRKLRDGS